MDTSTSHPYTPAQVIARLASATLAALVPVAVVIGAAVAATDDTGPPPEVDIATSVTYYVARRETSEQLEQAADPLANGRLSIPWPPR